MKTTVIIPHAENKDNSILSLLGYLKEEGILLFAEIREKLDLFHDGSDLHFEIPAEQLPFLLRWLDDSGFVYKLDELKPSASKHLSQTGHYSQMWIDGKHIEVYGLLTQTLEDKHALVISDEAPFLTDAFKDMLKTAIEGVFALVPQDVTKYKIDVQKIQYNSIGVSETDILRAVEEWAMRLLKLL